MQHASEARETPPRPVNLTVRLDKDKLDAFKQLVDREERSVSQDIRLYIQKRLERAKREQQAKAA